MLEHHINPIIEHVIDLHRINECEDNLKDAFYAMYEISPPAAYTGLSKFLLHILNEIGDAPPESLVRGINVILESEGLHLELKKGDLIKWLSKE